MAQEGGEFMCTLVQLEDGKFRLIIDYKDDGFSVHYEWTFEECERSEAEAAKTVFELQIAK